jgi:hypothetical protein
MSNIVIGLNSQLPQFAAYILKSHNLRVKLKNASF